jgi:hypothetical protein
MSRVQNQVLSFFFWTRNNKHLLPILTTFIVCDTASDMRKFMCISSAILNLFAVLTMLYHVQALGGCCLERVVKGWRFIGFQCQEADYHV